LKIATGSLHRYFFTLLVVLPLSGPLSAQDADKDGEFFVGFAGSAVFPYDPKGQSGTGLGGPGNNFEAGGGFTAAFGYAFKEGFSTEIEWGYQKVGIGDPSGLGGTIGAVVSIGDGWTDSEVFLPPHHDRKNWRRDQDSVPHGQCLLPLSQMESESLCRVRSWSLLP
jgi:hypothetical protein